MATFLKGAWRRHSNPWSVWTRILSYPLVYGQFWNRSWRQGAAVAPWFAVNPVLFPEPEGGDARCAQGGTVDRRAAIGPYGSDQHCLRRESSLAV